MENSTGSQVKEAIVIKIDDHGEPDNDSMALKMKENHEQNETGAANQVAASPANSYTHEAGEIESLDSASITTNINKNNNQEILPKDCVYAESIKGKFSWKLIDEYYIPYIIRIINGEYLKFVSVRMAETQLLKKYIQYLHPDVYKCTSIKSHFISDPEARLLNDINQEHTDFLYGNEMLVAGQDFIVSLEDVDEFYTFIDVCHKKLLYNVPPGDNNKFGFIRINSKTIVPYCTHNFQKYLPLSYFGEATESLIHQAVKLENWNLAYIKFCLKVQGTINELCNSDSCSMVSIDHIKNFYTPDTNFEEYWPAAEVIPLTLTNQSNQVNPPGAWIRAPAEVVPAENTIPRKLIVPAPSTPQSIIVTKNTYPNGCPANQMDSTMSQGSILINGVGHVVRPTPSVHTAVDTNMASAPTIVNTVSSSNVVHSYQYNMTIVNPMTYNYIKSHQSQTRQICTQRNNNIQFQQQQLQQQIITTLQPQQSYYIQQHNALRDVRKIVIPPASQTIDFSYPLSSPVPPTFQENTLYRNDGYELTRIPEYLFARDGSNDSAYKIQKATLQGRVIHCVIQCINAIPYIYSDLMVTLNDLVKIALPKCTIRQCACLLTKHFKITLYGGNSEQLALLRLNGRPWLMNAKDIPLAKLESINHVLPQLQTFFMKNDEEIQQYQSGIFKRQKPSTEWAGHGGSLPGWTNSVAGSSSSSSSNSSVGATSTHSTKTGFYSATEINRNDCLNSGTPLSQSPQPHQPPHPQM